MCSPTLRIQMLRTSTNENTPLGYDEMKTTPKSIFWTASESYLKMNKCESASILQFYALKHV